MPIGPLSKDFLQVEGTPAIEGATAQLFVNEGQRIRQEIEKNSAMAEAQAKGPILATLYADAYTKLTKGDLSGFGDLSRASAESSTNPFLAAMAKDATKVGVEIMDNYQQKSIAELSARTQLQREGLQAKESKVRQFQIAQRAADSEFNTSINKFNEEDRNYNSLPPEQQKISGRPVKPNRRTVNPADYGLNMEDVFAPQETSGVSPTVGTASNPITASQKPIPFEEPALPTKDDQQTIQVDKSQKVQLTDEQKNEYFEQLPVGNSKVNLVMSNIKKDGKVSRTVKVGGQSFTFSGENGDEDKIKVIEEDKKSVRNMNSIDQDFVNWFGRMSELGYKVNFKKAGKGEWTAVATGENENDRQYWTDATDVPTEDKKGTEHVSAWDARGTVKTITDKQKETWDKGVDASQKLIKSGLLKVEGTKSDPNIPTKEEKQEFQSKSEFLFRNAAKSNNVKQMEEVNKFRARMGFSQLKQSDFDKDREKEISKPSDVTEKEVKEVAAEFGKKATSGKKEKGFGEAFSDILNSIKNYGKEQAVTNLKSQIDETEQQLKSANDSDSGPLARRLVFLRKLLKQNET